LGVDNSHLILYYFVSDSIFIL